MRNTIKIALITLGLLSLTACSTVHPDSNSDNSTPVATSSDATAAGLNTQNGYQGGAVKYAANGEIINSLTAPSNQTYYFDFDSSNVAQDDMKAIQIQASYIATHSTAKVRLEGNTDNRGSREYNIGLGWRRDQAIQRLLEQQGVLGKQIDMVSYGKERPAVVGNNPRAWHLNRRVHLVYEAY